MGHINSTANLSLPQFIGTDKPTWLGDVNGAFLAIDAYVGTNDAAVAAAASDASSAISQASAAVNTANTANTTAGNASTAANNAIGVANTANAIAGTVDAKVGLLANLNTTDRTSIVNAINEVLADIPGVGGSVSVAADGVKTYSQLIDSLYAAADLSKVTLGSYIDVVSGTTHRRYTCEAFDTSRYEFSKTISSASNATIETITMLASGSGLYDAVCAAGGNTVTDASANVPAVGRTIELFY